MSADTTPESLSTPTTADIRDHWACRYGEFGGDDKQDPDEEAAFDRWIKAHDAEVARKALTDAADEEFTEPYPEDVFAPLSESDNIDINSTLVDYDVPGRDRISADMFRRAGNRLRARAEQIGEN